MGIQLLWEKFKIYYLQLELEVLLQPGALVLQVGLLQLFKKNFERENITFC